MLKNKTCFLVPQVKKTTTTAFFRVTNQESGAVVFEADTSGPDVHIKGNTMTFLTGFFIYLEPATGYTIHLDRGAVESADNCNTLSTEAGWDFTTKRCKDTSNLLILNRSRSYGLNDQLIESSEVSFSTYENN